MLARAAGVDDGVERLQSRQRGVDVDPVQGHGDLR
jgi:hypothetical protein